MRAKWLHWKDIREGTPAGFPCAQGSNQVPARRFGLAAADFFAKRNLVPEWSEKWSLTFEKGPSCRILLPLWTSPNFVAQRNVSVRSGSKDSLQRVAIQRWSVSSETISLAIPLYQYELRSVVMLLLAGGIPMHRKFAYSFSMQIQSVATENN